MTTVTRNKNAIFEHDCTHCEFVCHIKDSHGGTDFDAYVCPSKSGDTIILRFSDEGSDYRSWDADMLDDGAIRKDYLHTQLLMKQVYIIWKEGKNENQTKEPAY